MTAVLTSPGPLEGRRVDDQLVRFVAELAEGVRVRIGSAEKRPHQRAPLRVVAELVESGMRTVMRIEERRIAGVDDQDAHWANGQRPTRSNEISATTSCSSTGTGGSARPSAAST